MKFPTVWNMRICRYVNLGADYQQNKILHIFYVFSLTIIMVSLQKIQSECNYLSLMTLGYISHPFCKPDKGPFFRKTAHLEIYTNLFACVC